MIDKCLGIIIGLIIYVKKFQYPAYQKQFLISFAIKYAAVLDIGLRSKNSHFLYNARQNRVNKFFSI